MSSATEPAWPQPGSLGLTGIEVDGVPYAATLGELVAGVIVLVWGLSMALVGLLGVQAATDIARAVTVAGIALVLLGGEQLERKIRGLR
jgi:hypothetical protein